MPTDAAGITKYSWDHRNRLTKVEEFASFANYNGGTNSTQAVDYAYDYQNRLTHREYDSDGGTGSADVQQTAYVYDGNQIVFQFEKTGVGDILASDLKHRDLWGPAVDQLLAQENIGSPTETLWALTDNLNTVRDLATFTSSPDTTTIVEHRVYDAFGKQTAPTNAAVDCIFGYTGKLFDSDTKLQNNINRWYEAGTGKWLSKDPIGFAAEDTNLYRYCQNNPTFYVDPDGNDVHIPSSNRDCESQVREMQAILKTAETSFTMAQQVGTVLQQLTAKKEVVKAQGEMAKAMIACGFRTPPALPPCQAAMKNLAFALVDLVTANGLYEAAAQYLQMGQNLLMPIAISLEDFRKLERDEIVAKENVIQAEEAVKAAAADVIAKCMTEPIKECWEGTKEFFPNF